MTWALWLSLLVGAIGSLSQGFGDVRSRARQGVVGDWVYSDPTRRSGFGLNSNPQAAQITTVTLTDPGDSKHIEITINGVNVTIATGTGGDAASLGALLAIAINAEPLVRGQVSATFATTTLTLTGRTPGLVFTVSIANDPDAALSSVSTTTSAAAAAAIGFGLAVVKTGNNTSETEELVALASDSVLSTAQVITWTITYVSGAVLSVRCYEVRDGERILLNLGQDEFTSATDLATTVAGIATALNAVLPANTINVTSGTGTVIFTAEVKGTEIDVEIDHVSGGASTPTRTRALTTGPDKTTSLRLAWRGISLYSPSDEASSVGGTSGTYAANAGVHYAKRGCVWVSNSQTILDTDTVYVELDHTSANVGMFFNTSSSTRVALGRKVARWHRAGLTAADALASVRLEA